MKCVFMLASKYGMQCLDAVKDIQNVEIAGVLTPKQEYHLKYNGNQTKVVKNEIFQELMQKCGQEDIPVYVMEKMNQPNTKRIIYEWNPELIIVSGWYHIIGKEILEIPEKGVIGLHAALLPRYRGGAPLVWQIINGEEYTGITLFYIGEGIDDGDIIAQKKVKIREDDTIDTLYSRVGEEGILLLKENLPLIFANHAPRKKQLDLCDSDIYPQRSPQDGIINWDSSSGDIYNFVRAQTKPYPGAFTYYKRYKIIIWLCEVVTFKCVEQKASGVIVNIEDEEGSIVPVISTGDEGHAIKMKEYLVLNENGQEIKKMQELFRVGEKMG